MRWKSNKTKPVKKGLMDKIIYLDKKGYPYYNVELTGWGKDARIAGKTWDEIKDQILAWEYMELFEQHFFKKTVKRLIYLLIGKRCPKDI